MLLVCGMVKISYMGSSLHCHEHDSGLSLSLTALEQTWCYGLFLSVSLSLLVLWFISREK